MSTMTEWHSRFGGREWRVTGDGIESRNGGVTELHRTAGAPRTIRLYLAVWSDELLRAAQFEGVPLSLLLMTLCTENGPADIDDSRPNYIAVRREPGYTSDEATPHRISVGPCHVLISTAREAMGDPRIDRAWLQDVGNNIRAAARYIRQQGARTGYDPILVAAAYNSGGIHAAVPGQSRFGNRWHLRAYGNHLDRAAAWYGDAARVIQEYRSVWSLDLAGLGRVGGIHGQERSA